MRDAVGEPLAAARARFNARLATGACAVAITLALPELSLAQSAPAAGSAPAVQPVPAAPSVPAAPTAQPALSDQPALTVPATPTAPTVPPSKAAGLREQIGPPRMPDRNAHGPIGEDRLSADELYVEADSVTRDDTSNVLIARGNVLARYQDHTLRAQELIYNTEKGTVIANGHAEIVNPDGTVEYGEHMEMDDKLHAGFVTGFAATQQGPIHPGFEPQTNRVAAAAAIRRNQDVNELQRVVFTACGICTPTGQPTQPTWSIQASDAVQDKTHRIIVYRNAVIKVKGVPIFWTPVFWTPDPTNPRESGLLPPRVLNTQRLGFSWEQPYLWVISPSQDLEIRPQINTNVNPLLNLWYRQKFYSGAIDVRAGYTYERYFENDGIKFGPETSHSYILADGAFAIDNNWRWGFTGEHSSDPTFFDRYDIQNIYEHRGYFWDDTRRLTSQLYAVRQDTTSFLSITLLNFQSLRIYDEFTPTGQPVINPQTNSPFQQAEQQSALPNVAPLIEGRLDPDVDILGGRLHMYGSAVLVDRSTASLNPFAVITPTDPCFQLTRQQCPGVSSERASFGLEWRTNFTVEGMRISPFLEARGDSYEVQSGFRGSPGLGTLLFYPNSTIGRGMANLGVDLSYPLYRPIGSADLIIEPMAELILSPNTNENPRIPNEDSQALYLDETNMFRPDPYPGYDLYAGGPRASVGAMATLDWGASHDARLFVGREFRTSVPVTIPSEAGLLTDKYSDWVVFESISPVEGLNAWSRERFDGTSGAILRTEAAINWNVNWTHGIVRYLLDDTNLLDLIDPSFVSPLPPPGRREEAEAAGYVMVTHHWGAVFDAIRDLREDIWRRGEAGVLYRDSCVDVELVYQRNETNPLGPSSTVLLRLNFPMTGSLGFLNYENR